jgi:pimeloyl-ACP methyl ester carboxylesterase
MRLHDSPRITDVERQVAASTGHDWERLPQVGYLFLEAAARMRLSGVPLSARDDFAPFGEGRGAARAARAWLDLLETTRAKQELDEPGLEAEQIAALSMPVLLMDAEYSRCRMSADALQRLLLRPVRVTVPGAGHFFPLSHGPWLIEQLVDFLG